MTPLPVRILSIILFLFDLLAFIGSLFMWGEAFLFSFPSGVDYRFPVTDILVNAPVSILAAIGLWRMKRWGYAVSQFVAGFYVYASVEILVEVIQSGPPYPVEIVVPPADRRCAGYAGDLAQRGQHRGVAADGN